MKTTPQTRADLSRLCRKATEGPWTVKQLCDGKPKTETFEDGTTYTFEPEYFKYVDREEVFRAAYKVRDGNGDSIETLGNHECGALELPNADFIAAARTALPDLLEDVRELLAVAEEAANHLYTLQDVSRVRELAREALKGTK